MNQLQQVFTIAYMINFYISGLLSLYGNKTECIQDQEREDTDCTEVAWPSLYDWCPLLFLLKRDRGMCMRTIQQQLQK
ncbi:hypothetical protein [Thermaerobacillus caldiproteolyticus]|uniref:Uncharacterized protein n=1 Tax=Thermaerobacillus caldiproteolyticus TaxID=247480 RepID=A0A7W0BYL2_9BACL|nr:hypothetical protein [Anoxybacillus caldiproteolyticus]MBA2874675.1 hypothetical protein [Anoxybacillus caldiproteolyticus]